MSWRSPAPAGQLLRPETPRRSGRASGAGYRTCQQEACDLGRGLARSLRVLEAHGHAEGEVPKSRGLDNSVPALQPNGTTYLSIMGHVSLSPCPRPSAAYRHGEGHSLAPLSFVTSQNKVWSGATRCVPQNDRGTRRDKLLPGRFRRRHNQGEGDGNRPPSERGRDTVPPECRPARGAWTTRAPMRRVQNRSCSLRLRHQIRSRLRRPSGPGERARHSRHRAASASVEPMQALAAVPCMHTA